MKKANKGDLGALGTPCLCSSAGSISPRSAKTLESGLVPTETLGREESLRSYSSTWHMRTSEGSIIWVGEGFSLYRKERQHTFPWLLKGQGGQNELFMSWK